jgi:hypothetical protein
MRALCGILLSVRLPYFSGLAFKTFPCAVFAILCCGLSASGQQRDASAISFLNHAVTAAGGSSAIGSIHDFSEQGLITHNWDGPEQGELTVKSRGSSQFRVDSVLPEGRWSYIVNNGTGEFAFPNGAVISLSAHNTFNAGSLTLPICNINAALLDTTASIIDMSTVQFGSGVARQIRIQRTLSSDPKGTLSKLTTRDYLFEPSSSSLLEIQDYVHPSNDAVNGALMHILDFGNYQNVNGVLVPFLVVETLNGQQTWALQVSSVTFNTGLSDTDFQF